MGSFELMGNGLGRLELIEDELGRLETYGKLNLWKI